VPLRIDEVGGPLRFPVQLVVRPDASFRGFAGRVERGQVRPGMRVRALSSGRTTTVKNIVSYDGDLATASAGRSVTLELADEIDLSRGEMLIADTQAAPHVSNRLRSMVVWMHEQPLSVGQSFLLKHTTRTVRAVVRDIRYRVDLATYDHEQAASLAMNDIAEVELETALPLFFDAYAENRGTGAFILMDAVSNATVAAGMIVASAEGDGIDAGAAAFYLVTPEQLTALQQRLQGQGAYAVVVDDDLIPQSSLPAAARALQLAGVTAISARGDLASATKRAIEEIFGERFVDEREEQQ
jgi:sulfate adenylyltransferase subunit 1 (EFTu-like GTPase family)